MLAPGQRLLLVRNPVAFTARYGGGLPVAGQFTGAQPNQANFPSTVLKAGKTFNSTTVFAFHAH